MTPHPADSRIRFYDSIATEFDDIMNPYDLKRRLETVFEGLLEGESLEGLRVLDVGCGTGEFSLLARRRGADVTALDIGYRLLEVTKRKGIRTPILGDALALPFGNESFDLVLSSECIEHTTDGFRAVEEMMRVLRGDGRLVLTCPNRCWRWLIVSATRLGIRPYGGIEDPPSWNTLEGWIVKAGGRTVFHHGLHALPFQLPFAEQLLPRLDRLLSPLERFFINQCLLARKPVSHGIGN
jgi:SAM-dependent methyltransferase